MATLYDILSEIEEVSNALIDDETGEVNEDALDQLEQLEIDRDEKIENIGCLIKSLRADAKAIREEVKAQKTRAERKENKADRLAEWLSHILSGKAFSTTKLDVSFRPSERIEIAEGATIPDQYKEFKTDEKVNKLALKKAIKDGTKIAGVELVKYSNIQIK